MGSIILRDLGRYAEISFCWLFHNKIALMQRYQYKEMNLEIEKAMNVSTLQRQIIADMQTLPSIDVAAEIARRVGFIKSYLRFTGLKTLVLGLSGGIDSTTAGALAQQAVNELNSEDETQEYRFIAVRLPYETQADENDAQLAVTFIKPSTLTTVNIAPIVQGVDQACIDFVSQANATTFTLDFSRGNNKARARMMTQFYLANLSDGLVIGTDHSAEAITGFFTKFGDGACDIAPLFGLNKRQIRAVATLLGVPQQLVDKTPTADLEDNNPQQPDEASLGVTYHQIDDYLEGKTIAPAAASAIERRYKMTEHKRQGPVTIYCDWYQ